MQIKISDVSGVMRGSGARTAPRGPLLSDQRAEVMTFPSEVIKPLTL